MRGFAESIEAGMTISSRLLLLTVVIIVFLMASVMIAVTLVVREALDTQATEANIDSVQTYASAIGYYLQNARSMLEIMSHLSSVMKESHRIGEEILGHSSIFEYFLSLRVDGALEHFEPHDMRPSTEDFRFADWFVEIERTKKPVVSDLHISPLTLKPSIVVASPILGPKGELTGIIAGGLKLEALSLVGRGVFEGTPFTRYSYVTDRKGLIIAHQANPRYVMEQTDFSSLPPVRAALSGARGTMLFTNAIEGTEKLDAYMPLPGTGWAVVSVVPTRILFQPLRDLVWILLLIAVTSCLAMLLLMYFGVIRQITRPVLILRDGAERIGAGDFTVRMDVKRRDELGDLAESFNRMARDLGNRTSELTRVNQELAAFNYSVSHDLRAPLRGMDGFSQALLEDYGSIIDSTGAHYLKRIRLATQRMGQLIDDLLTLSRISLKDVRREKVDLSALAGEIVVRFHEQDPNRSVEFIIPPSLLADGDRSLLEVALENLLGNAWKFTSKRESARIELAVVETNDARAYCVRDNGVGFDMRFAEKLFAPFQRLHSSEEFPGTGIGLATVRRIVHRHGGRVWAESETGKGASFFFTLGT